MNHPRKGLLLLFGTATLIAPEPEAAAAEPLAAPLPPGVQAVWNLDEAYHETTPTRERICLNGLWQWQPAESTPAEVPTGGWGYFKVPGCWPGITDYLQKDCQTVFAHPQWSQTQLRNVGTAWYQRQITLPSQWQGRRIALEIEYLHSFASVFVDGKRAGDLRFPGGELELTAVCEPGRTHWLSLCVMAMPLKAIMLSYNDTAAAREVKGTVPRRGLCGDVYLLSLPQGPRVTDVQVQPSVRRRECTLAVGLDGLERDTPYTLRARLQEPDGRLREFNSPAFGRNQLQAGRLTFSHPGMPAQLWDIHTPTNLCRLELSLGDATGRVWDTSWTVRFGFREFWIAGRDFILNGSRVFLCALPLDNAQVGAAWATYAAARESLARLQSTGINLVYTHNYGCEPGSHLGFEEILRAADDLGMLVSFSQPHFSHYDWSDGDADRRNGYARHAAFYVRAAQNHPSVVMYSMSHNATGYSEDMNPDMIDGIQAPRDSWARNNSQRALRAEAIVKGLDPSRLVYHHASGNLGALHAINFYPNFVPIQEMSDWFETWATRGVKPVFTCEYGAPFTWDWTMYRGWYKGQRAFGSARVPWEFCLAEWNAQFLGNQAYQLSEAEKSNIRWEARQFRAGKVWQRWDYPAPVTSHFTERYPVFARYFTGNWPAFRTWGVSAISPWEHGHFWSLREGIEQRRQDLAVDWQHLQRPGFSPDYLDQRVGRMDLAYERADWTATAAAEALLRYNQPLLAYLAGRPGRFTSQDHNFYPGETVEKQIILINNSRTTVTSHCEWSATLPRNPGGQTTVSLETGQKLEIPLRFTLPADGPPGPYQLNARVRFSNGQTQADTFAVDLLKPPAADSIPAQIALFDPRGETGAWLRQENIPFQSVKADADLSAYDILIVGKLALTVDGPAPNILRVRQGLKVLLFEQTSAVLEKRFGFRVVEYGLRQVFPRVPDHPTLAGLAPNHLRDWRGEASLLPPRLKYQLPPGHGPTVEWCEIPVTRPWRCGNRGNVASVLIEKPARGDFLPILDGGFSLQFSPLLEHRDDQGIMLFCQLDVTGRTEPDPAAQILTRNLLRYLSAKTTFPPRREALYAGDLRVQRYLQSMNLALRPAESQFPAPDQVLIVGPRGGPILASQATALGNWLNSGGHLLMIGVTQEDVDALLPFKVRLSTAEHLSEFFEPFPHHSPLAGISPADVHDRDPQERRLIRTGAQIIGNGILARANQDHIVFCQLEPWQYEGPQTMNRKRTQRRHAFLLARLLANLGVAAPSPLPDRFHTPVDPVESEHRWLSGLYVDQPEEWDDPYRFFRW